MSKAEKMLEKCDFYKVESPFDDWYSYRNKQGIKITFQDDYQYLHCGYEISFSINVIEAIHEKIKELGWYNE